MADFELGGVTRGRSGSTLPGVAPSNVYTTRDGVEVLIAGNADTLFGRLCQAMDRDDLATDPRFATHQARGSNAEELDAIVGAWTAQLDSEQLEKSSTTTRSRAGACTRRATSPRTRSMRRAR